MKRSALFAALLAQIGAVGLITAACAQTVPMPAVHPAPAAHIKVTGPITSGNLSVYLIHGKDKLPGAKILTLEEALAQKKIVVNETGDVNQLTVQNLSDEMVFIQSGDIVKGGRQDRAMQYDMILPPKSGVLPLPAFCVEHGRWTGRGNESAAKFDSSANALASKELKIAAKARGDQGQVWANVSNFQTKLASKSGYSAVASPSPSSFELTVEDKKVQNAADVHVKRLEKIVDGQSDVIGYSFAINGKINSADSYASHQLFTKLWPKLLKSSAIEAVADEERGKTFVSPEAKKVDEFVANARKAPAHQKVASKDSGMSEREGSQSYAFETRWYASAKQLQGATNGIVGPQGSDATFTNSAGAAEAPEVHMNILSK